jgi:hypothetical protein
MDNPDVKQYAIFSLIVSMIISFFINFYIVNLLENSFILYGFPISLKGVEGFANTLYRFINTIVVGIFLSVPMYFFLDWLKRRM